MPEPTLAPQLARSYQRGRAVADLVRPQSSRIAAGIFLAAAIGSDLPVVRTLGGLLLIATSYGLAATLNDLADVETDRRNRRDRPLATGALDRGDARRIGWWCAAGIAGSQVLLVQPAGLVVTTAAAALAAGYSAGPTLQRRGIVAHALLACGYLVLPVVLAVGQGAGHLSDVAATCLVLAGSGAGVLLYKDFKDEAGDRATGKRTPLVRWGPARTHATAQTLVGLAIALGLVARGPGWWTVPMVLALGLQMAHGRGRVGLSGLRNAWFVACLLLVAG